MTSTPQYTTIVQFAGQASAWPAFSLRLQAAMDKAKLSKIAAGTEVRPPDITGDAAAREARAKLQEAWDDKNRALHTMVVERLEDSVLLRVAAGVPHGDGVRLFQSLQAKFNSADEAYMCTVLRTLARMEPDNVESVPAYTAEAVRLGTLLTQAGLPLDDRLLRMLIISALPEEMESVRTHLLYAKDTGGRPLDLQATQEILQTAQFTREGIGHTPEGVNAEGRAAVSRGTGSRGRRRTHQDGQNGSSSQDVGADKRRTHYRSAKCKQRGCTNETSDGFNYCERCYQTYKAKQDSSGTSRKLTADDDDTRIQGFTLMLKQKDVEVSTDNDNKNPDWLIIDSGCNRICFPDINVFNKIMTPDITEMEQTDGRIIPVCGMGQVNLRVGDGELLTIPDALYIPDLSRPLLSVSHLVTLGCTITMGQTSVLSLPGDGKVSLRNINGIPYLPVYYQRKIQRSYSEGNVGRDISNAIPCVQTPASLADIVSAGADRHASGGEKYGGCDDACPDAPFRSVAKLAVGLPSQNSCVSTPDVGYLGHLRGDVSVAATTDVQTLTTGAREDSPDRYSGHAECIATSGLSKSVKEEPPDRGL